MKDGSDDDLTQEPEMIRAFRDTWELGVHSYLTYLRDRLLLAKELLHESGSCFVQISDENIHHVRELMDDVFGAKNLTAIVVVRKTAAVSSPMARTNVLPTTCDYLVWYAKDAKQIKYRQIYLEKGYADIVDSIYSFVEEPSGARRRMTPEEAQNPRLVPRGCRIFLIDNLTSTGWSESLSRPVLFEGEEFALGPNLHWKTTSKGMHNLIARKRVAKSGKALRYIRYFDDFPVSPLSDVWLDTTSGGFNDPKVYVVQTNTKVLQRCVLMTTDPGDLVFDPTCGSGTTAYVAEQWGRRWITCDTSRVAVTLAKQRLVTSVFDFYELAHQAEGIASGFVYKAVPHVTLKSIANNEPPGRETLYDQAKIDSTRARVTGPFTVEAVPAPTVRPMTEVGGAPASNASIARSGETLRQAEWRTELLKTGIRGKNNQMILFSRVEPLAGTRWLHADAESMPNERGSDRVSEPKPGPARSVDRVVVSFGPEHAPLEQRQVELAWEEARTLSPRPGILAFAAFQFDPEAAKDIDELTREKTGMTFLKVHMNPDLLTEDLKKKRASNESFWLMGQPDIEVRTITKGEYKGKVQVEVHGFDYYNTKTGAIESGDTKRIAMWMLDPDYDGRSLFPRQVFFPMADDAGGWARLARNLKAGSMPSGSRRTAAQSPCRSSRARTSA